MTTVATEFLDRRAVPWLFAVALATTLPHVLHHPAWLSALAGLILAWGAWLWWRGQRLPGRWVLAALVAAGCGGILIEFHTLLGRDAGVAMLVLFMAMKLLELRSRRDAYIVVNLGYFLLLTHYFYSQSISTGLGLLGGIAIITATLVRLHGGPACAVGHALRHAVVMMLQALPFLLALYLLFPRVSGPLWGLPQDAQAGQTGLSDQMAPGTIAQLALSSDIAFRVRFDGPPPRHDLLYWRGPVLENYDGLTWRPSPLPGPPPRAEALSTPVAYETTLEPHAQRWLLALDVPTVLPPEASLTPALSALSRVPLSQRQRYRLASSLDYRFNRDERDVVLKRNLQLPAAANPDARALAQGWRNTDPAPEHLVQKALAYFRERGFAYTLQPPLLASPNPMDQFLFQTRRGFCEHYAAAFVVLMRAAGVPARVVGGYQGGELNPVDGYLMVRQSDAHAWAEVWLAGRGWVRVDPTAAVAPASIETSQGSAAAVPGRPLPLMPLNVSWLRDLRYRWEAIDNAWNQWVLGYNPQRQRELLTRLGVPDPDWRSLSALLAGICGSVLVLLTVWALYRRPPADPALKLWRRALTKLARRQVTIRPWETPLALADRLRIERPEVAPAMATVAAVYCQARYGAGPADAGTLAKLRAAIAQLP